MSVMMRCIRVLASIRPQARAAADSTPPAAVSSAVSAATPARRSSVAAACAASLLAFALVPTAALADANHQHGTDAEHDAAASASDENAEVRAEVRRVNTRNGTVSLRHEALPHLDMPPMSMTFRMEDPEVLEGLERGDEVMVVIQRDNGEFFVESLRPAD